MFLIVGLILLLVLPSPWNVLALVLGLAVFVGELAFWNRTVRNRRIAVGAETLIGKTAVVVSPCRPDGQVRLAGEIWAGHCDEGADKGATVIVTGLDGLTVRVEQTTAT